MLAFLDLIIQKIVFTLRSTLLRLLLFTLRASSTLVQMSDGVQTLVQARGKSDSMEKRLSDVGLHFDF